MTQGTNNISTLQIFVAKKVNSNELPLKKIIQKVITLTSYLFRQKKLPLIFNQKR